VAASLAVGVRTPPPVCRAPPGPGAGRYGVRVRPIGRPHSPASMVASALAAVLLSAALTGCATVKPPSTVPPTGWPEAPAASGSASVAPRVATGATPSASPALRTLVRHGVTVPIPEGYVDATALASAAPTTGAAKLVAFLRNPAQHTITVQRVTTDQKDLTSFVNWYTNAQNAGTENSVESERAVAMAGIRGTELTLKSKTDASITTLFVTMNVPGSLVMVYGASPTEERRQAIESVAKGLRLGS